MLSNSVSRTTWALDKNVVKCHDNLTHLGDTVSFHDVDCAADERARWRMVSREVGGCGRELWAWRWE